LAAQSTRQRRNAIEGAPHERHDLEGGTGEAGLDAAFGHRVGGGLFNRDYRARISVGKRSGVRPGVYRASARSTSTGARAHARRRLMPLMIADRRPLGRALTPIAALGHRPSAPIAARRLSKPVLQAIRSIECLHRSLLNHVCQVALCEGD